MYRPFIDFHETIPQIEQRRLSEKMKAVLKNDVFSAYESLYSFFIEDYLPNCRETIACADFPNGKDYYQYLIKRYTTTDLKAREIHNIGLKEVERIKDEMKEVIKRADFEGSFDEFLNFPKN